MITSDQYIQPAVEDPSNQYPQPEGKGPEGRPLCRWCHKEVPKRKRAWCGELCINSYLVVAGNSWGLIRDQVRRRDKGICSECGCDTVKMKRIAWIVFKAEKLRVSRWRPNCYSDLGYRQLSGDWWQADHIIARKNGGKDFLDNLRTLCIPCHKARTAEQHHNWTAAKNDQARPLLKEGA